MSKTSNLTNRLDEYRKVLPAFPRTPHLPYQPNLEEDDFIATESETSSLFIDHLHIEEKIDGASVGLCLYEGHPLIRNRDHILNKGYVKDTAAKKQFAPLWNWFYEFKVKFKLLENFGPYSIYGEWCLAQHGIHYTKLPDWFLAYDLYDYEKKIWVAAEEARNTLIACGFYMPQVLFDGVHDGGYAELAELTHRQSSYTDGPVEGIYIKQSDDRQITNRFKMVRTTFERGKLWDPKKLIKNETQTRAE